MTERTEKYLSINKHLNECSLTHTPTKFLYKFMPVQAHGENTSVIGIKYFPPNCTTSQILEGKNKTIQGKNTTVKTPVNYKLYIFKVRE